MATTFRALVMLTVLVGLPAAWVYYGPLPPDAQRMVDRLVGAAKETIGWDKPTAISAGRGDSPLMSDAPAPAWNKTAAERTSVPVELPAVVQVEAPSPAASKTSTLAERVDPLLAKLREFGVVAYDLEPWGTSGKFYRFHCEMPLEASGQATQEFQAVAADPQATVEQVVAQVAQWHIDHGHAGM